MGCSSSKKTEEAASVQICRDRKNFIKQAIKYQNQLASSHIAYVQSLRQVSIALCTYVDENRYQYSLNSYMYHPYRSNKIFIEPNVTNSSVMLHYSRSQPELPKTGTIVDAKVYQTALTSMDEDEYIGMEEAWPVEGDKGSVLEKRRNRVAIGAGDVREQTPSFTVHLSRIPASMLEVMKEIEAQFTVICDAATEVAALLEVSISNNHSIRAPRDGSNSNSDVSDERFELFKSHKSSLERLYAWEKKLYEEVKSGERIRVSYEKKFSQLKNQDLTGAEPSSVEKTRASMRDLRTRLNVSFTSVETISKRIETVRDEELHPQITQLIQALAKLWKTMSHSHSIQKHTLSQAKLLLQLLTSTTATASPSPPVTAAATLASELRHWRLALSDWTTSQRAYATALSNWAHTCVSDPAQGGPLLQNCTKWVKAMETVDEKKSEEGIKRLEERVRTVAARGRRRELEEEDWRRAICEGVAEVVAVVEEVAATAAEAYEDLVGEWRDDRRGGDEEEESRENE